MILGRVNQTLAEVGLGQESLACCGEGLGVISKEEMDPVLDQESFSSESGGDHRYAMSE